jgi:UDP-glucose 4-epimerase
MRILVTGSSGYVGRHLVKMLFDHDVTGLDITYRPQITKKFIQQNILENKDIEGTYDYVIHLAALANVKQSMICPMEYYRTNITGTMNILERVNFKHFIFASTGAAVNPTSPYALSKRNTEDLVKMYCDINNKQHTIFRFYNVIGYDVMTDYYPTNIDSLMYNLREAKTTGKFYLHGNDYNTPDGTAIRDYIHVNEICCAMHNVILKGGKHSGIQNLGSGQGHSVKEIVDVFKEVNNADFEVIYNGRREGDLERSVLDSVSPYMQQIYNIKEKLQSV